MKEIKLTQGQVALVDNEDFERVINFKNKWYAQKSSDGFYAKARIKDKKILMHRIIMGVTDSAIKVDHINHNTLDNRKENLRVCTNAENGRNRKINRDNTTGYKGVVCFSYDKTKFIAQIKFQNKQRRIGMFKTAKEAAIAYNEKAKELFGEFANLNPIA